MTPFKCAQRAPPREQATIPKIGSRAFFDSIFLGKRWKSNELFSKYTRVRFFVPVSMWGARREFLCREIVCLAIRMRG